MSIPQPIFEDPMWPYIVTLLPTELDELARSSDALVRCRNVPDAASLIRLALAYAVSDLSMKDVAAWAKAMGVADITGPGLFYRLRESEKWLQQVLALTLEGETGGSPVCLPLRVVDATVINGPGADGTEWRAHVLVNPDTGGFRSVEITDEHGGEGYSRYIEEAGEIIVGDRAYATARGIAAVTAQGAYVVARLNPHVIRLCNHERERISLLDYVNDIPIVGAMTWNIIVPIPPDKDKETKSHKTWDLNDAKDWIPARVIAARTRNGDPIWILTTVPVGQLTAAQVANVYRLRWQIELFFKRLKSLLHLDTLPSRQGPTAKSWMLSRFIAAALAQKMVPATGPLSPWGYAIRD